jgi:cell fate (sporulation/competence/biofilm development) regulator YlbF (YheA/YmcA/DUF963 family)
MEIIEKARAFASEIQKTEVYKDYLNAKEACDKNEELQSLIGKFNLIKLNIDNEIAKDSIDNEKLKEYNTELQAVYDEIMRNEFMSAYNEANAKLSKMLGQFDALINAAVNGEDVFSFDVEAACSGNCSSCGGCN